MGGVCGKDDDSRRINPTALSTNKNYESFAVGEIKEIAEDNLKEIKIDDEKSVLVGRIGNEIFAIGSKCPHAGAPLKNGVLRNGKVRCPWHAACFDLKTGDLEDFPGFDCIPTYKVEVKDTKVYVKLNRRNMKDAIQKPMAKMTNNETKVVIIGSGPCGYSCAQTLREEGYNGEIIMITKDKYPPYDRTKLTKKLRCSINDIKLREEIFYKDNDIKILLNEIVDTVNVTEKEVILNGNPNGIKYNHLFIAVGIKPRIYNPPLPGSDLKNIYVLHSLEQCEKITEGANGAKVVIVGSSFISMELAEMLSPVTEKVYILSRSKVPYNAVFGNQTGEALLKHFQSKLQNVEFQPNTEVVKFLGDNNGEACGVETNTNAIINCTIVVIAIGGIPNTEFLTGTGIQLHSKNKSIIVNEYLATNCDGIYAGGDAVSFPFDLALNGSGTVAHWQLASRHGKIAAQNILRKNISTNEIIPFFWTNVCGLQVRYLGYGEGYDETLIYGSLENNVFCIIYRRRSQLIAVCCVGCGNLASELAELFKKNMKWDIEIPEPIIQKFQ